MSAAVSYDAATLAATLTLSQTLAPGQTYTATVTGGSAGVKDLAGNALAASAVWSFTTAAAPGPSPSITIWGPSAAPANFATSDTSAVELGLKFRSDVAGTVTGVRFYKGTSTTGTHTGTLWSSSGTMLATATFTGESSLRLAAGHLRQPGRDRGQHGLRRLVSHQCRSVCLQLGVTSRRWAWTTGRSMRSGTA